MKCLGESCHHKIYRPDANSSGANNIFTVSCFLYSWGIPISIIILVLQGSKRRWPMSSNFIEYSTLSSEHGLEDLRVQYVLS